MKQIDQKYIEDLLFSYFAGELTEEQDQELLEWLQEDPTHKEILSEMSDWWATAHVPFFASTKRTNFNDFFGHLTKKDHPGNKSRIPRLTFIRNIAAAIMALTLIGSVSYYMGKKEQQKEIAAFLDQQNIVSEITTPMGATTRVTLPDGSEAWVNAGTTLVYKYNYGAGIREVQLNGEAYFDVKPDKEHPFIVKSNELDIKVLGTSFNVKSYMNEEAVKVALVTGSVHVQVNQVDKEAMDFTLSPDRMLTFNKESHNVEVSEFRAQDAMAWTKGRLIFENLPFPQIAKDLERKFNVRINIESKRLQKEIFSGSFSADHSLDRILREVDMEKRYRLIHKEDEIIIRDK